jgi:squalene-hopene/tetraprenyl-beta-curcumene cyclase
MRTKYCTLLVGLGILAAGFVIVGQRPAAAADESAAKPAPLPTKVDPQAYKKSVDAGMKFLLSKQNPDGSFNPSNASPAITAICLTSLLRSGASPDDPAIAKGLKYLEGFVQSDGGIYKPNSAIQNYETGIAIMCFAEANKSGRYKDMIKKAEEYIKSIQWGATGNVDPAAVNYGGAGYGASKTRPDLSNTSFLLDALQAAGDESNDAAVQRALVFVSRCQNLATEYNNTPFAAKNPDGGFYYTPADGGNSAPGGKSDDGGLRSYGSMTYAGLKSMIFAGLKPDDVRVKAAVDWIKKHYTLADNPGMGQRGLYYGYHTFAKALSSLGQDPFVDDKGMKHAWKAELVDALIQRQKEDGSWVNSETQFQEGNPNLVTSYALLTLSYCKPTK